MQFSPQYTQKSRSAHLSGWARIETPIIRGFKFQAAVAPTFRGGRGLKQHTGRVMQVHEYVAPTFRGGRGLKQREVHFRPEQLQRSAHLSGWARIETVISRGPFVGERSSAHLSGWARIETMWY